MNFFTWRIFIVLVAVVNLYHAVTVKTLDRFTMCVGWLIVLLNQLDKVFELKKE